PVAQDRTRREMLAGEARLPRHRDPRLLALPHDVELAEPQRDLPPRRARRVRLRDPTRALRDGAADGHHHLRPGLLLRRTLRPLPRGPATRARRGPARGATRPRTAPEPPGSDPAALPLQRAEHDLVRHVRRRRRGRPDADPPRRPPPPRAPRVPRTGGPAGRRTRTHRGVPGPHARTLRRPPRGHGRRGRRGPTRPRLRARPPTARQIG